jgi:hypothetical protein
MQRSRESHEYSDEYLVALNDALLSGFWHQFQQLPLAEQKRQQHAHVMREWVNALFYNQRIDENQTFETYALCRK